MTTPPKPYPAYFEPWAPRAAAVRFGIGAKTAIEWVRWERETGERQARRQGQPKGSKLDAHEAFLLSLIKESDDLTLAEMQARLRAEKDVTTGLTALWRFFKARGLSYKKSPPTRASRIVQM